MFTPPTKKIGAKFVKNEEDTSMVWTKSAVDDRIIAIKNDLKEASKQAMNITKERDERVLKLGEYNKNLSSLRDEHRRLGLAIQDGHIRELMASKYLAAYRQVEILMPNNTSPAEKREIEERTFCVSAEAYRSLEASSQVGMQKLQNKEDYYSLTHSNPEDTKIPALSRVLAQLASEKRLALLEDLDHGGDLATGILSTRLMRATKECTVGNTQVRSEQSELVCQTRHDGCGEDDVKFLSHGTVMELKTNTQDIESLFTQSGRISESG